LPWKISVKVGAPRSVPWLGDHDEADGLDVVTACRAAAGVHRRQDPAELLAALRPKTVPAA